MGSASVSKNTNSANLLIVDDEPSLRRLLTKYLEEAGYTCQSAANTTTAKELLSQSHFDLALCDLDMPGESALELIRHIKVQYPETGRVMVTSSSDSDTTNEILDVGVYGYILKPFNRSNLLITVQNSLQHLRLDRDMQRHKKSLEEEVWKRTTNLTTIMDNLSIGVIMYTAELQILEMNRQVHLWFPDVPYGSSKYCFQLFPEPKKERPCDDCPVLEALQLGRSVEKICQVTTRQGKRDFRIVASPIYDQKGHKVAAVGLYNDITEKNMLEQELRQAQKIEAIGQLAAGISHEINIPVQYVGHNLSFLNDAFTDITKVLGAYDGLNRAAQTGETVPADLCAVVQTAVEIADLDYLAGEILKTISQAIEGIQRVEKIVLAMKEFSHPGTDEKTAVNINQLIESTLTISRNQWKYVVELETDLQPDLPLVPCLAGELNQVFLNIIVNAAHAIESMKNNDSNHLGNITITTRGITGAVEIHISDTGGGIPAAIQDRVFDSIFTTKALGKGTGQGLAIARRVVVDKPQGHSTLNRCRAGEPLLLSNCRLNNVHSLPEKADVARSSRRCLPPSRTSNSWSRQAL